MPQAATSKKKMRSLCSQALPMADPLPHLLFHSNQAEPQPSPPPPSSAASLTQDDLKRMAAHKAVELVESNMVLGLGTGSTAYHALERIGELLRQGKLTNIVGIPTSKKTEAHAVSLDIPLTSLTSHTVVDLSIDGADEVDPFLNLVKGRGGSLLREKMIEGSSKRFVVIVDDTKIVERIGGSRLAVPVEVIQFGWQHTLGKIKAVLDRHPGCECEARLRTVTQKGLDGQETAVPAETDNLNYVVDLFFESGIHADLNVISDELLRITGVVEHGMFLGLATSVIVAGKDGITVMTKEQ